MDSSASHVASGGGRPKINEIFAPEAHAGALDPNVTVVLGSRGAGKSFWAGVLGDDAARAFAADAYPRLGLQNIDVKFGFTGVLADGSVSRATIDSQVPIGSEDQKGPMLWRCVLLKALKSIVDPMSPSDDISTMMAKYTNPEMWENDCIQVDKILSSNDRTALIIFDALDSLAMDWERLRKLIDSLLEIAWLTRGFNSIRVKLFLRPDQLRDIGLRFVELPKLLSGATKLTWSGVDLYGMLFTRLAGIEDPILKESLNEVFAEEGVSAAPTGLGRLRSWPLAYDKVIQARVFARLAGPYMGSSHKKGKTYDWPLKHLGDGHSEVTPRSFLTLMIEAARRSHGQIEQVLTAEAIRHGLREASKFRVDQLNDEFPWIKRVLLPLARLQVPCADSQIVDRWRETATIEAVMLRVGNREFLGPFDPRTQQEKHEALILALVRIGVLIIRGDGRYDMPDLFRVAARLLKKGAVAPI
ncbi:hypothetical protein SAMN05428968_2543 [Janthinobacterium sp. YR213]|nr:hypothetical protein SAMN05428968_2543 [Janthinobacterium sp. YR213]